MALGCLSTDFARHATSEPSGRLEAGLAASLGHPLVDRMLHLELLGFLPDLNLNYTDKAAMTHGVEVRVPFLDTRILDLAARIPWQLKTRGLSEKWILKQAFRDRLPASILRRKKTGFGAPVRRSLMRGRLKIFAEDTVASRQFRERGLFDAGAVRALLNDTGGGNRDGAYCVLAILALEYWLRRFVDKRAPALEPTGLAQFEGIVPAI
jgi:asparagine synthase (glutamine-hydrolysing)